MDLSKTFDSVNPIVLTFTVAHDTDPGNPYSIIKHITNNTNVAWIDFYFIVTEQDQGSRVIFTSFNSSTLSNFTFDSPPASGPHNPNFTGNLADGGTATATFDLSPFDPGAGNTITFTLTQIPTIPEPKTYAMLLAGLGLMDFSLRKQKTRKQKQHKDLASIYKKKSLNICLFRDFYC